MFACQSKNILIFISSCVLVCMYVCMCVHTCGCEYVYVYVHDFVLAPPSVSPSCITTSLHYIFMKVEHARAHASIRGCKYSELVAFIVRARLQAGAGKHNEALAMLNYAK